MTEYRADSQERSELLRAAPMKERQRGEKRQDQDTWTQARTGTPRER